MASFPKKKPIPSSKSAEDICTRAWRQFESQFPSEEDCWRELYRRLEANGQVTCGHCGGIDLDEDPQARVRKCRGCNKKTWLTAGTFFNRMRKARPWLAAIWLTEQGVVISSLKLHTLVGIAQSSALYILRKIAMVIQSHFGDDVANMPSGHFRGVFCKRSRLTPAREHPVKEQEEMERDGDTSVDLLLQAGGANLFTSESGETLRQDTASVHGPGAKEISSESRLEGREKEIYDLLSKEPVSFDSLCNLTEMSISEISSTLTMLEITGVAERLPGDRYVRKIFVKNSSKSLCEDTVQITKLVSDFINFVRSRFHGISRKYLQLYLAVHWCYMARSRWCKGSLLQACLDFGYISHDQSLAYVSPLIVKISPEPMQ